MKKSIEQIGLILAILIASISLPTAVVSLNQERVTNNYDNTYNTYLNQTIIETNITDYSTDMVMGNYNGFLQYDFILQKHQLSSDFAYWYYWNASAVIQLRLWVCQAMFYEDVIALNGSSSIVPFIDDVKVSEKFVTNDKYVSYYIPPFEEEWLFIWVLEDSFSVNITLQDQVFPL